MSTSLNCHYHLLLFHKDESIVPSEHKQGNGSNCINHFNHIVCSLKEAKARQLVDESVLRTVYLTFQNYEVLLLVKCHNVPVINIMTWHTV